jgi:hypothetical protein
VELHDEVLHWLLELDDASWDRCVVVIADSPHLDR